MSALFKTFCEHPVLVTLALLLYVALSMLAMKIGFAVMVLVVKALTWVVPQLDVVGKFLSTLR